MDERVLERRANMTTNLGLKQSFSYSKVEVDQVSSGLRNFVFLEFYFIALKAPTEIELLRNTRQVGDRTSIRLLYS